MKNLELLELSHKPVTAFSDAKIFTLTSDAVYFVSNNFLQKHDFSENITEELCPLFGDVTHLKYVQFENKICIATTENLQIFNPNRQNEIQYVNVGYNIAAISWNPTEELIAVVAQNGEVLTYSIDYENAQVFPQGKSGVDAKVQDTVYVGWGSKETQFRGSEGKYKNRQPGEWGSYETSFDVDFSAQENPVKDRKPRISWRGNGEMFAVNYWVEEKRKFVVFETPCRAVYRSEDCPGLQPPIAWRPTGNMIATLAEIDNKHSVVIFEKNGQKRFSFELDVGDVRIKNLKWSPCAQVLSIHTENVSDGCQNIHLLMSSNYKWYEKQKLVFTLDNQLLEFDWLESTQFTVSLNIITQNDIIHYTFISKYHRSEGNCAVINAKILQLTDFKDSIVPPVMYSRQILNDTTVNFCIIKNKTVTIVDAQNYLKIFDIDSCQIIKSVKIDSMKQFPLSCHHFVFDSNSNSVYFASESESETVFYNLHMETLEMTFISVTNQKLRHLLVSNDTVDNMICVAPNLYVNNSNCDSVFYDVNCRLTSNCHFYIDNRQLSDCVNSFIIFDDYLLYTTKQNQLFCLRLKDCQSKNQNYCRNIEQSATIVAAIPDSSKIVLQLRRGNLETISCRLISIDILDKLLNEGEWEEALRFVRLEKLNSNLLFDLDPQRFLQQVDRFVSGAKTLNELNSLCLEFEKNNVFATVYKNWGNRCDAYPGKLDAIFGEIFKIFDRLDYASYITTITVISLNFFTIRNALVYLQDLLRRSYEDKSLKEKLTEAVNTLKIYGCDQDKLYSEALLLYDLDFAHFLASCCQLDPRIYEPHLNNLKALSEVDRRYEINIFAKKPKSAIAYLLRSNQARDSDILTFIQTHDVSKEAYESCPRNNRFHRIVSGAFARNLSRRGLNQEAGLILKRGGLLEEALEEFKLGLNWREVLNLLNELEVDDAERSRIVSDVAKRLSQKGMIKDAAILYEFYDGNYEMAVKILLENCYFEECLHVARKHNRGDIVVSEIIPALYKHKTYLEEQLLALGGSCDKYRTRLAVVRRNKIDRFSNVYEPNDKDDLFSDAGSTITKTSRSSRSRSSTASSRNRRKEERKKQDLKEGGVYEDIALIRALHCTIKEIYSRADEVRVCCVLLLQESDASLGEIKKFHDLYKKVVDDIQSGVGEIWPPHFHSHSRSQNVGDLTDLENFEHLDAEYRAPPVAPTNWKLSFF